MVEKYQYLLILFCFGVVQLTGQNIGKDYSIVSNNCEFQFSKYENRNQKLGFINSLPTLPYVKFDKGEIVFSTFLNINSKVIDNDQKIFYDILRLPVINGLSFLRTLSDSVFTKDSGYRLLDLDKEEYIEDRIKDVSRLTIVGELNGSTNPFRSILVGVERMREACYYSKELYILNFNDKKFSVAQIGSIYQSAEALQIIGFINLGEREFTVFSLERDKQLIHRNLSGIYEVGKSCKDTVEIIDVYIYNK